MCSHRPCPFGGRGWSLLSATFSLPWGMTQVSFPPLLTPLKHPEIAVRFHIAIRFHSPVLMPYRLDPFLYIFGALIALPALVLDLWHGHLRRWLNWSSALQHLRWILCISNMYVCVSVHPKWELIGQNWYHFCSQCICVCVCKHVRTQK